VSKCPELMLPRRWRAYPFTQQSQQQRPPCGPQFPAKGRRSAESPIWRSNGDQQCTPGICGIYGRQKKTRCRGPAAQKVRALRQAVVGTTQTSVGPLRPAMQMKSRGIDTSNAPPAAGLMASLAGPMNKGLQSTRATSCILHQGLSRTKPEAQGY